MFKDLHGPFGISISHSDMKPGKINTSTDNKWKGWENLTTPQVDSI